MYGNEATAVHACDWGGGGYCCTFLEMRLQMCMPGNVAMCMPGNEAMCMPGDEALNVHA